MNVLFYILGILGSLSCYAQANRVIGLPKDTLQLPFTDDFYSHQLDTNLWLNEGGTFLNNGFPISPPTAGVITFDGKQSNGTPYVFIDYQPTIIPSYSDSIDYLVSNAIDLSQVKTSSNLALSFFWQMGGKSETNAPELEEGDSLHLFFLTRDTIWKKVWPAYSPPGVLNEFTDVAPGDPFQYKFIPITDSVNFYHEGFRMKFIAYGSATGPYDIWSIDYIHLDTNRTPNSRILDFAFNTKPTGLLKNYSAIPISHIMEEGPDVFADEVITTMMNASDNNFLFLENTAKGNIYESYRNQHVDSLTATNQTQFLGSDQETQVIWNPDKTTLYNSIVSMYDGNPIHLRYNFINKTPDFIPHNDSIHGGTYLNNYYAYDDGTAESGMGIYSFGFLAIQYNLLKKDTLKYIDIYFPKMEFNLQNTSITLKVWENLKGIDGASSTKQVFSMASLVQYKDGLNQFYHYQLPEPLILNPGNFYIGFEQNIQTRIYIGWDKSTDHSDKVYYQRSDAQWVTYQESDITAFGSPMIRPRFGAANDNPIVSIIEGRRNDTYIELFPNPSSTEITLFGAAIKEVVIYDLTGQEVVRYKFPGNEEEKINIQHLPEGMYLVKVAGSGFSETLRFMKI